MHKNIKVIAFDADDTLWVNEPYFQQIEQQFCTLLADYLPAQEVSKELFKTQVKNLPMYGYGIKCFVLSMIETASRITNHTASMKLADDIIALGHELLEKTH